MYTPIPSYHPQIYCQLVLLCPQSLGKKARMHCIILQRGRVLISQPRPKGPDGLRARGRQQAEAEATVLPAAAAGFIMFLLLLCPLHQF
jgi:hypothetical protein